MPTSAARRARTPPAPRRFPSSLRIGRVRTAVLAWFSEHNRKFRWRAGGANEYLRVVSEALLQRTRAESVQAFLPKFLERFPNWSALAKARRTDLEHILKPLGLWRRRARSLRALAHVRVRLAAFPTEHEALISLPAIGQYLANAIGLLVHGQRRPLLDVNMARFIERYYGPRTKADIRYDPWLQGVAHRIVDCDRSLEVNWAILDLAAAVCIPARPRCTLCPVSRGCAFSTGAKRSSGAMSREYRRRSPKKRQASPAPTR